MQSCTRRPAERAAARRGGPPGGGRAWDVRSVLSHGDGDQRRQPQRVLDRAPVLRRGDGGGGGALGVGARRARQECRFGSDSATARTLARSKKRAAAARTSEIGSEYWRAHLVASRSWHATSNGTLYVLPSFALTRVFGHMGGLLPSAACCEGAGRRLVSDLSPR